MTGKGQLPHKEDHLQVLASASFRLRQSFSATRFDKSSNPCEGTPWVKRERLCEAPTRLRGESSDAGLLAGRKPGGTLGFPYSIHIQPPSTRTHKRLVSPSSTLVSLPSASLSAR